MKLSYSAYSKYHQCPKSYEYYYIEKIRPERDTSALLVGSFVDNAVQEIIEHGSYKPMKLLSMMSKNVEFFPDDVDFDLIDVNRIEALAKTAGWKGDDIRSAIKSMLLNQDSLSRNQQRILKIASWLSLSVKIDAMLDSFKKWILPQIKEVISIQHSFENDYSVGVIDLEVILNTGEHVLLDLKTSKMSYPLSKEKTSAQLHLYDLEKNVGKIGYVVLVKTLNKNKEKLCSSCGFSASGGQIKNCQKCKTKLDVSMNPTSYSQLIYSETNQFNKDLTKQAFLDTIKAIEGNNFPRNLNACDNMFGKPCKYKNICWK